MGFMKRVLLGVLAVLFVGAGVTHFTAPEFYVEIVPPWLPSPRALVWLSGVCEIGLGLLVLVPATRRLAAWGLVLLLLAVFPANVHMAVNDVQPPHAPAWMGRPTPLQLWLRLPLQFVLIAWAWWYTRDDRARPRPA
jgi:uncharacterized membrane protein